jgi:hypothetical protein
LHVHRARFGDRGFGNGIDRRARRRRGDRFVRRLTELREHSPRSPLERRHAERFRRRQCGA